MSTHQVIASTSGNMKYITGCRLCGKPIAESSPIDIPIVGEKPGKRAKQREAALLKKMYEHLVSKHQPEFREGLAQSNLMTQLAKEYKGFLILGAFECPDPSVSQRLEYIRSAIFASVRKNTVADSVLDYRASLLGGTPEQTTEIAKALRAVRDVCCEFGQYAPESPAPSPLVTP